ncbi:phosphomannomutase/phosphoglucomutase [Rhodococcus sp. RS1C4]|uniref:phosphomannomutase/phosphoglucomutase n=1 Tax=Nocardiaceae TaxID=85025 RepID=UPI00037090E5|nr:MULTISPECIES: phosphomannomutase/phosphoglucomutase [Rhodococcus]OZC44103.1 phosphomannomutase/phosphoglucomutase [Rhodococcus sp. RS1C4]OZC62235.1 phosphomannomutase/phosphoglucomutase [Rhodococcus sp. 06-621-2]OZD19382.1 phosphomannomutase/phosphoglucomutase [Rhodococcus sp. 06-156-3C]OZD21716.1 phosphomannomutase/phosphoglucomutase [Rhodococcus sp. 06-156-4C]OZD25402.1 phosphomannomutase/phosphoglucomutase [Rhodococcus sp. 06-156-4a]
MARTAEAVNAVIKAYDVRGVVGEQIDAEFVRDVGASFARLVREPGVTRIVIGHDMRASSPELSRAFADGVTSQGLDVVLIGLASTDQLYFASGSFDCPGAMFTASHNPAKYNGIKLCRAGAKPVGQDTGLATIKSELVEGVPAYDGTPGSVTEQDVLVDYANFVRGLVDLSQVSGVKIAVDAGNGMGGHTVPAVFDGLPVTVEPLYFELDGTFPNHEANPLDPANLVDLQKFVRETGADIGLAFDGDADRCFVVDENGDPVSPSAVTGLVAERELRGEPGATIIHNLITSRAVPELVTALGGTPVRTRVGHSFIKQQMAETGAIFGGEHSAHYYFKNFWGADSGMLAALHVLAALGSQDRPLSELMRGYETYSASGEINSTVDDAAARTSAVLDAFAERTAGVDRLDGVTVDLNGGAWFNLRASNTEPLLRLNVEARTSDEVDALTTEILGIVRG